ncbi:MAG: hypothetical protein NTV32_09960 [Gammaproteobacteria bacterium]|nr:hypothetical protein [Gammaproteobacteria bacterium]
MPAPSPYEGLPDLSNLLDHFNQTLHQEMQEYATHQDTSYFQKLLDKLGADLNEFIKSIDIWHDLSTTPSQVVLLQQLEGKVDHAQHLITKAIGLIKPEQKVRTLN